MIKRIWRVLEIIIAFQLVCVSVAFSQHTIKSKINWQSFLNDYDPVYDSLPTRWEEAPYFGNGFIGSMIYADTTSDHTIKLQVFRTDVYDHRGDSAGWTAYSRPRLPIGYLTISLKGKIKGANLRQKLYTADLSGKVETTEGSITIHHFVAATKDIISTKITNHGKEKFTIVWHAAEAKSTRKRLFPDCKKMIHKYARAYGKKYNNLLKVYQPNPDPIIKKKGAISLSVQNLLAGGQYVVGWRKDKLSEHASLISITIQNSYPAREAESKTKKILSSIDTSGNFFEEHKIWWSNFYRKSFVSIPDKELEGLYWLQMYKVGSASRPGGPIIDTSGPWFQETPWPYITWDLNVELSYWMLNTSNHLDLAMSLPNSLNKHKKQLIRNVKPVGWQKDAAYLALATAQDLKGSADDDKRYRNLHANLPWIMHNVWLIYQYSMDKDFLRIKCYPLLKRSTNYYLHIIKKEKDGKYHIPIGYSPEYPAKSIGQAGETKDPNIDIALLKWGLRSLVKSSETLHLDEEKRDNWQNILNNLVDFQVGENGFKIGADMPYTIPHRHYSHLLMIYPLYLVNIDQQGTKELMQRSLKHWIGNAHGLQGYSYTGAASISAAMGKGNSALKYLKGLNRFLLPNGLYKESGPVIETPLSAAQSIQDMLLQSWGNKIRVFPAVPDQWKNVVFHKWLAKGAFQISAKRVGGKTKFIAIKSLKGSDCVVQPSIEHPVGYIDGKKIKLTNVSTNTYKVALKKGQQLLIKAKNYRKELLINKLTK